MSKRSDEVFYEGLQTGKNLIASPMKPPPVGAVLDRSGAFDSYAERPVTAQQLFMNPNAHPVVLDMALLKKFQVDWVGWMADTLFWEIEREFKTSITLANRVKIMAAKTLHVVDAYWDHWEVFEKVIAGLNGIIPQIEVMQPPNLAALYAGVDIANSIRKEQYGDEVKRYCAAVFLNEGATYALEPLSFCQEYISQPTYRCKDCDKTGSALPPFDGHCPSCTQKFEQDKALSLKPDPDMKDKTRGDDLEYDLTFDFKPTKARFEELSKMSPDQVTAALQEVSEDVEAGRLIVATDFMRLRTKQLKEQLEGLRGWLEAS